MTSSRFAQSVSLAAFAAFALLLAPLSSVAEQSPEAGAVAPAAQQAEPDCAGEVVRRVQAHYDEISDFAAEFEQTTKSVVLGGGASWNEAARGTVVMAKPGSMRWEYREPQQSVVVSDGADLWIYDVAAGEAQHMVASAGYLSGAAVQFLMGRGVIARDFVATSAKCSPELPVVELDLVPRAAASYERLGLRVDPGTGEVLATTLVDLFGNVTTISFRSLRTNLRPPATTFQFDPPPGVERIELTPPAPPTPK